MAGSILPAMASLFAAGGAASPARAVAPAQDARQRVDPVTAVALAAANRRGCWIANRSDRARSSNPPVPRLPDFRNPAETSRRAHFLRVRTEVVTGRSGYPSTYWYKGGFRTEQLGLPVLGQCVAAGGIAPDRIEAKLEAGGVRHRSGSGLRWPHNSATGS